ncbi:30S ribosomal protein S4e [Candidatus Woesearchaeota archaeon]|nr:30S ribosomal protein S4e [Candidatus Woesearchaeota archaeon]
MGKEHLKRLAAPRTWQVARKKFKFIIKPASGTHSPKEGISFGTLLKEMLSYANSSREAKKIINTHQIKIDGKARKDFRFPVGIFDTIEFSNINENFRVIADKNGKIGLAKIKKEEASLKPCKIIGKTPVRGKIQLNLFDGNNILTDNKSYKVGDTLLLELPGKKIAKHLKLDKKSAILLTGGKHMGETGHVEDISGNKIIYKNPNGELVETSKKYAFVIGDDKPLVTIRET